VRRLVLVLLAAYVASYTVYRGTHQEVWQADGQSWLIFPENRVLYYVFRPLALADSRLTGLPVHIGPHAATD
jgi:hypothetical protein